MYEVDRDAALFVCVRNVTGNQFGNDPGGTQFLSVPVDASEPLPANELAGGKRAWVQAAIDQGETGDVDPNTGQKKGDLLVFVHGFNNSCAEVLQRHRVMAKTLVAAGYKGGIISFDWPSAQSVLNYYEDRSDAKDTARSLVTDCISLLAGMQEAGKCYTNVHLLCHSTGAFVVREASDDAEDRPSLNSRGWTVSQVCFISGDVSSSSLSAGDSKSAALFARSTRITNYFNPLDSVLKLSNIKRFGTAPRLGRVGLPDDAPDKCTDVDCGDYFRTLEDPGLFKEIPFSHAWYFGNEHFAQDLAETLRGDVDRNYIDTRTLGPRGKLELTV
jgi:hypothetical protein